MDRTLQPRKEDKDAAVSAARQSGLVGFFDFVRERAFADVRFLDLREQLVRKARLVVLVRTESDQQSYVIDLKNTPAGNLFAGIPSDGAADVTISIDSRERFVRLISEEEDGMQAYQAGAIKLDASLKTMLKLRNLRPLAERFKEDMAVFAGGSGAMDRLAEAAERTTQQGGEQREGGAEKVKEGYLEKRSEWLKSFNSRFVVLKWNDHDRPRLFYYNSQSAAHSGVAPRGEVELHSAYVVTATSSGGEFVLSLVDKRASQVIVFRTTSQRSLEEWAHALRTAIHARAAALSMGSKLLTPTKQSASVLADSSGFADTIDSTLRQYKEQQEQLKQAQAKVRLLGDELEKIRERLSASEQLAISESFPSDLRAIINAMGWMFIPASAALATSVVYIGSTISSLMGSLISTGTAALTSIAGESVGLRHGPTCTMLTTLALLSFGYHIVSTSKYFTLFRRRLTVYTLAARVILGLKISLIKSQQMNPLHQEAMWRRVQISYAEEVYALALDLKGLWVKTAQFLGARPDVMPDAIISILQRLHDAVPANSFTEVKEIIETELGKRLDDVFSEFEQKALASASIGQVHKAVLKNGVHVVVKVQHPGVRQLIEQDLVNLGGILRMAEMVDNSTDLKPVLLEWTREVSKELDFRIETTNMLQVGKNLASDPNIRATLPTVLQEYSTEKVLVMRFVEGAKVTDPDALKLVAGVETDEQKRSIASDVCHAFAHQLFIAGVFNADPHPGNLLVARREVLEDGVVFSLCPPPLSEITTAANQVDPIVVLLDFGLTKTLPKEKRLAFSRLLCAIQAVDISGMFIAFKEMGLILRREDPFEDMRGIRFAFRDTKVNAEARAETRAHVERVMEKYDKLPMRERNPIESFPPELMLFFRTVFLLRGICGQLGVRYPYLRTMSEYAKRAMLEQHEIPTLDHLLSSANSNLETRLRERLGDLKRDGEIVGIQIYVLKGENTVLADIAEGTIHYLDRRPVTRKTLFPAIGIAQSVSQIAAFAACERAEINDFTTPIQTVWSQFGLPSAASTWTNLFAGSNDVVTASSQAPKRLSRSNSLSTLLPASSLTVGDLLSGDTSVLPFIPSSLPDKKKKFTMKGFKDWKSNSEFVAELSHAGRIVPDKTKLPWELSHLAFSWGWGVLGLAQALSPSNSCALADLIEREIATERIDCPKELLMSLPENTTSGSDVALLSVDVDGIVGGEGIDFDNLNMENTQIGNFAAMFESVPALKDREYLMDPRLLGNSEDTRTAIIPCCGMYCTAKALAKLFSYSFRSGEGSLFKSDVMRRRVISHALSSPSLATLMASISEVSPAEEAEPLGERLGLSKFEFQVRVSENEAISTGEKVFGVGQVAFGGSCVVHIMDLNLTVAVLVNDLSMEREATKILLEEVANEFNLHLVSEV